MQTIETYPTGAIIIKQGANDTCFYVLQKGAVEIFIDDTLLNVIIYPGSIFGEMGFISGKARSGSIRARNETTVIKYECQSIEALIEEHPDVAVKMIKTLSSRLARTTEKLSEIIEQVLE
ncbi:MAG: Crp/Fnr family transcriptional regulator [Opitutaceae bacterium]